MLEKPIVNVPEKHLPNAPLTEDELRETAKERVSLITKEFNDGFSFLENYPKSVTIFGGARFTEADPEYEKVRELGSRIATDLQYSVLTGGGPGLMEAANRGAKESGGESLGLTIELSHHQIENKYLTNSLNFYYFFCRKVCMSFSAEAYIFCPGGFGTFDEFFEIITLIQTKKIEKVPIILFGMDFWKPLEDFMKKTMQSKMTIDADDLSLYVITDNIDEIINIIKETPIKNGIKFSHTDLEEHGIKIVPSSNEKNDTRFLH